MDIHDGFVGATKAQLDEAHRRDLEIQGDEGVSFDQAWLDPQSGKVFCLSSGPSREAVTGPLCTARPSASRLGPKARR